RGGGRIARRPPPRGDPLLHRLEPLLVVAVETQPDQLGEDFTRRPVLVTGTLGGQVPPQRLDGLGRGTGQQVDRLTNQFAQCSRKAWRKAGWLIHSRKVLSATPALSAALAAVGADTT